MEQIRLGYICVSLTRKTPDFMILFLKIQYQKGKGKMQSNKVPLIKDYPLLLKRIAETKFS